MNDLCIFGFFVQKSFLTKDYFLAAEIDFTTQGPLYILVFFVDGFRLSQILSINVAKTFKYKKKRANNIWYKIHSLMLDV